MKKSIFTIAAILGVLILAGCESRHYGSEVTPRVRDQRAYALGERHAAELIAISDNESAVQDELLEIRARIYNFSTVVSPQSGADYERGFTDYIKAHSDSLAGILF